MRTTAHRAFRHSLLSFFAAILAGPLTAATYLPLSDADLARRSPVIVRAQVNSQTARLEKINGRDMPITVVTFARLETLKGRLSDDTFRVRLPGGRVGNMVSWVPGTPSFELGQEVLLFLRPAPSQGDFFLTEFGLGHFEIRADATGRRFALRPAFSPIEDDYLSKRSSTVRPTPDGASPPLRDAESFKVFLKATARRSRPREVLYALPRGYLADSRGRRVRPLWLNAGGPEPGNPCGNSTIMIPHCLVRWFWDTGKSPNGVVTVSGTQSNLSDSSNGTPAVQNAVTQWHGVANTDVRYSGLSASGNVSIQLDAPQSFDGGGAFKTPLPCGSGGVLGLGGSSFSLDPPAPYTFKGDGNYFPNQTGIVTMRQVTGPAGCYDATLFKCGVLHEVGHTLGLGHPDQGQSTHSTTTSADWAAAVMHSVLPPSNPTTPQTDDIQAIQFYYGTGVLPTQTPTPTLSVTRTPTGTSSGSARGHVTPLHYVTPKSNVNGRQ